MSTGLDHETGSARDRAYNCLVWTVALVWRRMLFGTTVVAITGSVGKTTAKECLAAILRNQARTINTIGNFNTSWNLTRILLRARPSHRFVVVEAAILKKGQMRWSALLLRPDIVVMLGINWQHSVNFESLDVIASEKAKLLSGLSKNGCAVLNGDDPRVAAMAKPGRFRSTSFGSSPEHDLWADQISAAWPARLTFCVHAGDRSSPVRTRLVGAHWATSVLGAIAAARHCGVSLENSIQALESIPPFTARLEPVKLPQGAVLLRDEYNGSMATLLVALHVLKKAAARRRVAIIGNISDAKEVYPELSRRIGKEVAAAADVLVFVGDNSGPCSAAAISAGAEPQTVHGFPTVLAAADFLRRELRQGDLALLKGTFDDHLSRIYFHQSGTVGCWKIDCKKSILCDECPELEFKPDASKR